MSDKRYGADEITVLKDLEPVQLRPGMYTDTTRPNHLGQEVIDNSVDEALSGYASHIDVILHADNSLEVIDNGRGMPVDIHSTEKISGVELSLKSPFAVNQLALPELNAFEQPLYLNTWIDKFGYMYNDIQLIRAVMYIAMVLVIGVACFNIISTLIMAVKDKQGDIAIMRTLGANNCFIKQIFLWYGLISGMKGAVIGLILGVLLALNLTAIIKSLEQFFGVKLLSDGIYFIDFLPSELHWQDIVYVLLATLVLSLCASLYPASRAAKLSPAQVLSGH